MSGVILPDSDIVFNAKPDAVPYNYRISYKTAQLCLIMSICGRSGSCSLIKLQMISYALLSAKNREKLLNFTENMLPVPLVRFDPAVNRALTFLLAYGFVEQQKTGTYKLTQSGKSYSSAIINDGNVMLAEIQELRLIAKKLTETKINTLVSAWRKEYAED